MKNPKIEYKFIDRAFAYDLPLLGVDIEFLAERRKEAVFCITQVKSKIGEINIGNLRGVQELELACKVLHWCHAALKKINYKDYMLKTPKAWDKQSGCGK